jgi:hypothetical protein
MSEWPPFQVTFIAAPGVDATKALRATLKTALRCFGLRCVDAYPIFDAMSPDLPAQIVKYCGLPPQSTSAPDATVENAKEAARRCLRSEIRWDSKEKNFLNEATRLDAFSERQLEWLRALYRRTKPRPTSCPCTACKERRGQ